MAAVPGGRRKQRGDEMKLLIAALFFTGIKWIEHCWTNSQCVIFYILCTISSYIIGLCNINRALVSVKLRYRKIPKIHVCLFWFFFIITRSITIRLETNLDTVWDELSKFKNINFICQGLVGECGGYTQGAPDSACQSMLPGHSFQPQVWTVLVR